VSSETIVGTFGMIYRVNPFVNQTLTAQDSARLKVLGRRGSPAQPTMENIVSVRRNKEVEH